MTEIRTLRKKEKFDAAQNFKTPAELGISEKEFTALVTVLGMFERGEIVRAQYSIGSVCAPECGTPGCIRGWARHVAKATIFPDTNKLPYELRRLFFLVSPSENNRVMSFKGFDGCDPELAARVTRNYLTYGEARWQEALETA